MYSEMLADGMVKDDANRRQLYLETLRDESGRLSTLVENVLAYARLEEGRAPRPAGHPHDARQRCWTRWCRHLRRRAERRPGIAEPGGRPRAEADAAERVDVEAVGQILAEPRGQRLQVRRRGGSDRIDPPHRQRGWKTGRLALWGVRDHGPGVPGAVAATIFDAFDRGTRNDGDPTPGVGLGLALARGLARDMGGDLQLIHPADNSEATGAHFELGLPLR